MWPGVRSSAALLRGTSLAVARSWRGIVECLLRQILSHAASQTLWVRYQTGSVTLIECEMRDAGSCQSSVLLRWQPCAAASRRVTPSFGSPTSPMTKPCDDELDSVKQAQNDTTETDLCAFGHDVQRQCYAQAGRTAGIGVPVSKSRPWDLRWAPGDAVKAGLYCERMR